MSALLIFGPNLPRPKSDLLGGFCDDAPRENLIPLDKALKVPGEMYGWLCLDPWLAPEA